MQRAGGLYRRVPPCAPSPRHPRRGLGAPLHARLPTLLLLALTHPLPRRRQPKKEEKEKPAGRKKGSILGGKLDIDEKSDVPFVDQLRNHLVKNSVRILDLFREWDEDGDGRVTKKEFRNAMPLIGLDAPVETVDALFDSFDEDGQGAPSPPSRCPSPRRLPRRRWW